jgi:hypothetical protein
MQKRTRAAGVLAALVLTAGLTACGDDDDPAVDSATDDTEADAGGGDDGGGGEGDLATYCDKTFEIETLGEPEVDFETASEEEVTAAVKEFAATMQPIAADIEANAPEEIEEDIALLVAAVDELAETGDFETAFDADVEAAGNRTHAFDVESCGWNVVDVTATNYKFEGIPDTLDAGPASFELSNEGTELHEVIVLRKKDDTTESFDELLALPQEEAEQKVDFKGAAFGAPGEEGIYAVVDLTPGEYMAICFIPVGSVDEETPAQGPPHFTQGMKQEFSVS